MILIKVKGKTFGEYISSLSKKARKNFRYVKKHNTDLVYRKVPYDRNEMAKFMDLWEQQLIRGERKKWAFGTWYLDKLKSLGRLRVFVASKNGERIALHFVENHEGYIECHPPMYDKKYSRRYLAKFMWFNLIKYALEDDEMEWIDLGGGSEEHWRAMIKNRKKYPNPKYKFMYVPRAVKDNPDKQPKLAVRKPDGALGDIKYIEKL